MLYDPSLCFDSFKVAELATQFFIVDDKPIIAGLVLAGQCQFHICRGVSNIFASGRMFVMCF